MSETFQPPVFNPPPMPEALQDLRVFTVEEAHEALAALERRLGVVEVDLVEGEEPEEGVEVEVVPVRAGLAAPWFFPPERA